MKTQNNEYDYLIIGAGLFGSVFAHEMTKRNKRCLVLDKRKHIAGNCYTQNKDGINIHKYGAHIFHTNSDKIWNYINQFCEFNNFVNSPKAFYNNKLYSLPFNMNTFYELFGTKKPEEAKLAIQKETEYFKYKLKDNIQSLEDYCLCTVGETIYETLIKGYTEKQWNKPCSELPSFLIKRLPLRFIYNNNYFNDKYQGIPNGGYTQIFEKLLDNVEVITNVDFLKNKNELERKANKIIYTGAIDEYYDYCHGELEYRSLRFHLEKKEVNNFQGNAVINYTEGDIPFTRIIEHKHFELGDELPYTYITKEYPYKWNKRTNEKYYPINNTKNKQVYDMYKEIKNDKTIFKGRLGEYKYYDMHQVLGSALTEVEKHENV